MRKSEREYFRPKVNGTIKRAKIKIKLDLILFSERKYLRPKVKDTIKRAKYQIYLSISEREYLRNEVSRVRISERNTKFASKREQKKFTFYAKRKQIEQKLNIFEKI